MSSTVKMPSKYAGTCAACGGRYGVGAPVTLIPPGGKRKRWIAYHSVCAQAHGNARRSKVVADPVARNADWLTEDEQQLVAQAWGKRVPPLVRDNLPHENAETLAMEEAALDRILDPAA